MLYPKEEETEADCDTVPRQHVPAQQDLTQLLSSSVKWVGPDIFLAREAEAQRLTDLLKATQLGSSTAGL